MNIQPIAPSFTGDIVYRVSKEYGQNSVVPFFENRVLNVLRKQKLPARISGNNFDVTFDSQFQQNAIKYFHDTLNEAGIKFKLLI